MTAVRQALTEAQWQQRVVDLARLRGWWVWHDHDSRRNLAGLPDLLLVRDRQVWAELKTDRGRLRPEQDATIRRLLAAGAEVHIWKPADWDAVQELLR